MTATSAADIDVAVEDAAGAAAGKPSKREKAPTTFRVVTNTEGDINADDLERAVRNHNLLGTSIVSTGLREVGFGAILMAAGAAVVVLAGSLLGGEELASE